MIWQDDGLCDTYTQASSDGALNATSVGVVFVPRFATDIQRRTAMPPAKAKANTLNIATQAIRVRRGRAFGRVNSVLLTTSARGVELSAGTDTVGPAGSTLDGGPLAVDGGCADGARAARAAV